MFNRGINSIVILSGFMLIWQATAFGAERHKDFIISTNIQVESGDTWTQGNAKFRLYGVQSCLRGTDFVQSGMLSDCGLTSIAHFAALIQSSSVLCQPLGTANDEAIFVVCGAKIGALTVDVGTALIASGYAFAAVGRLGNPINTNYLITELVAKEGRQGLWAGTFAHPVDLLLHGRAQ